MVLNNGRLWRCYHLSSGTPPSLEEVFEVDLIKAQENLNEVTEQLYLLSKEAIWRDAISDYWEVAKASSPSSIAQCLLSERILNEIRKELYRKMKQKIDVETIFEALSTQVIKGNILSQVDSPSVRSVAKQKTKDKTKEPMKSGLPAVCWAYVPDPSSPRTWRLKYRKPDGSVSLSHLSGAVAALSPGGFRGKHVEIPVEHLQDAKKRLLEAYQEIGTPEEQIPPGLR